MSRRSTTWNRTRKLSISMIGALLLRDDFKCAYCAVAVVERDFEIDHICRYLPEGERDRPGNLVISCADCNRIRGRKPVPKGALAEVQRRLNLPVDLEAGRKVGDALYPWEPKRRAKAAARKSRVRIQRLGDRINFP